MIKLEHKTGTELVEVTCPECGKTGEVLGDQVDSANNYNEDLRLPCGHIVPAAEVPGRK